MVLGLDRVETLAASLGNPEQAYPSILIAGTNGKGSVAAILDTVFLQAGLRTGRYTSPHLVDWNERIAVSGEPIAETAFARALGEVYEGAEEIRATPFEAVTMAAFWHFRDQKVERAVVEVGLGGRLDATRLCRADIAVVTAIDLDHTAELGSDLNGIAREKAAIARPGSPLLLSPGTVPVRDTLLAEARHLGVEALGAEEVVRVEGGPAAGWGIEGWATWLGPFADLVRVDGEEGGFPWRLPLAGDHMLTNLNTALAVLGLLRREGLKISNQTIQAALARVSWPGRLQYVPGPPGSADLVLDVGHNPLAARFIAAELGRRAEDRDVTLVIAMARDKNVEGVLEPLLPLCLTVVATTWGGERALDSEAIATMAGAVAARVAPRVEVLVCPEPLEALAEATSRSGSGDLVVVAGSHMIVGPVLEALQTPAGRSLIWPE